MTKILTVINQYQSHTGGAENVARFIVEQVNNSGIHNDVLTLATDHMEKKHGEVLSLREETSQHYTIHRFRYIKLFGHEKNGRFFKYITLLKYIYHLIRLRETYDLIHVHTFLLSAVAAIITGRIIGKPVIITGHTTFERLKDQVESGKQPFFLLWILKYCDCYVAINQDIAKQATNICSIPPTKIKLIYNGIDIQKFRPLNTTNEKKALRSSFNLPCDRPIIIFHGRLDAVKNIKALILALDGVLEITSNKPYLVILGTGPTEMELRKIVSDLSLHNDVLFTGTRDNIHEYLQAADIYCLPSFVEGFSLALLEAMASGLICLASDIPGNREAINNNINGKLFSLGKKEYLKKSLLETLESTNDYIDTEIGIEARKTVINHFSGDKMINEYLNLYHSFDT